MTTSSKNIFFAGGGTGGHIYPAIAIAEKIAELDPTAKIHFFCSERSIDQRILSKTCFTHTTLPAKGLSFKPIGFPAFAWSFLSSYRIAKRIISGKTKAAVVSVGGFVAAPVCLAAHKLKVPIKLLNVDVLPGLANKLIARWADEIFVQFEETAEHFAKTKVKVHVVGCPLRSGFEKPETDKVKTQLGLDQNKKTLLITGASSGSENINEAVYMLLPKLNGFSGDWQIVHVTGVDNYKKVRTKYEGSKIKHKVLGYSDDMPNLLATADIVVGRSGAVSVAEYAAASVPSICIPYPYHKDMQQYLNAGKLVEIGAAVIVDDLSDVKERAEWLWEELEQLMNDEKRRDEMRNNCTRMANTTASLKIAEKLLITRD